MANGNLFSKGDQIVAIKHQGTRGKVLDRIGAKDKRVLDLPLKVIDTSNTQVKILCPVEDIREKGKGVWLSYRFFVREGEESDARIINQNKKSNK